MSVEEVKGRVFSDQMHRISSSLTQGELLGKMHLWPFLTVTQDINPKRYFPVDMDSAGVGLTFIPPSGKVWRLLHALIFFDASSEVADRGILIQIHRIAPDRVLQRIFDETIAADASGVYQIGGPAPTVNAYAIDRWDAQPVLSENIGLKLYASNQDAGDTFDIWASIEEWVNYEP